MSCWLILKLINFIVITSQWTFNALRKSYVFWFYNLLNVPPRTNIYCSPTELFWYKYEPRAVAASKIDIKRSEVRFNDEPYLPTLKPFLPPPLKPLFAPWNQFLCLSATLFSSIAVSWTVCPCLDTGNIYLPMLSVDTKDFLID